MVLVLVLVGVVTKAPKVLSWADARREPCWIVYDEELRVADTCSETSNGFSLHFCWVGVEALKAESCAVWPTRYGVKVKGLF